jgi:hypothetical protein
MKMEPCRGEQIELPRFTVGEAHEETSLRYVGGPVRRHEHFRLGLYRQR